jgi:hypothetical protein
LEIFNIWVSRPLDKTEKLSLKIPLKISFLLIAFFCAQLAANKNSL